MNSLMQVAAPQCSATRPPWGKVLFLGALAAGAAGFISQLLPEASEAPVVPSLLDTDLSSATGPHRALRGSPFATDVGLPADTAFPYTALPGDLINAPQQCPAHGFSDEWWEAFSNILGLG